MASGRVYQAIKTLLDAEWTLTPIAYENTDTDKDGAALPPSPQRIFVEVELTGTSYEMQSMGENPIAQNRWDEEGILYLNVNVPKGKGALAGRTIAKQLVDIFRGRQLLSDALQFGDAGIGQGQPAQLAGNWWMIPAWVCWRMVDEPIDGLE
jgi:hypothetical protein